MFIKHFLVFLYYLVIASYEIIIKKVALTLWRLLLLSAEVLAQVFH